MFRIPLGHRLSFAEAIQSAGVFPELVNNDAEIINAWGIATQNFDSVELYALALLSPTMTEIFSNFMHSQFKLPDDQHTVQRKADDVIAFYGCRLEYSAVHDMPDSPHEDDGRPIHLSLLAAPALEEEDEAGNYGDEEDYEEDIPELIPAHPPLLPLQLYGKRTVREITARVPLEDWQEIELHTLVLCTLQVQLRLLADHEPDLTHGIIGTDPFVRHRCVKQWTNYLREEVDRLKAPLMDILPLHD
jgi:hypothetical protein